jgi:TonB family protein
MAAPVLGGVKGLVMNASTRAPVSGALVVVRDAGARVRSAITNGSGDFIFAPLSAGQYGLMVQHQGYETVSAMAVDVEDGYYTKLTVALTPGNPDSGTSLDLGDEIVPPVFISGPSPSYPAEEFRARVEGTMIVKCVITVEGRVTECVALKPLPMMTKAALYALEQRRYHPAMRGGEPIEVDYTFVINVTPPR